MIPDPMPTAGSSPRATITYVTVEVGEQMFGLPIKRVHDVFVSPALTVVPLAPPEVAGLLNLRGRVVTAIDLRRRFGMPQAPAGIRPMTVGIEDGPESFGFIVDAVGEVVTLDAESRDDDPAHLSDRWAPLARGIHRLQDRLLVVLNVDSVLNLDRHDAVA